MNLKLFRRIMLTLCLLTMATSSSMGISDAISERSQRAIEDCPISCECIANNRRLEVECSRGGLDDNSLHALLKSVPLNTTKLVIDGSQHPNDFKITTAFKRFTVLQELHLINCGLRSLGERTFARIRTLQLLNLAHNLLSYITPETFESTDQLLTLNLAHNRLSQQRLPTGAFSNLKRLQSLSLAHNNISQFPKSFLRGMDAIRTLDLDGNRPTVERLRDILRDVPNLTTLSLNGCRLGKLPGNIFETVPKIEILNVADNNFGLIPIKALKRLRQLTKLDLSGNGIVYVQPRAFFWAPHLQSLSLAKNKLGECYAANSSTTKYGLQPLSFANVTLVELDLSYNVYREFDSGALGAARKTLRILHLSGNPLRYITERQTYGVPLTQLHIADAQLSQLPFSLPAGYAYLRLLNISHNRRIGYISEQAANQLSHNLISMDISDCDFRLFPPYALYRLASRLRLLKLDGNPWDCHCHIMPLRNVLQQLLGKQRLGDSDSSRRRLGYDRVRCNSPEQYRDIQLLSVSRPPDCALWLGAASGLTRRSEIGIIVALLFGAGLLGGGVLLFVCYRRNWKHSGAYETREGSRMSTSSSHSTHLCPSSNGGTPATTPPKFDDERDIFQVTL